MEGLEQILFTCIFSIKFFSHITDDYWRRYVVVKSVSVIPL